MKKSELILIFICIFYISVAQNKNTECTGQLLQNKDNIENDNPTLNGLHGKKYNYVYNTGEGTPFMEPNTWCNGSLSFGKRHYNDLMLKYDLVNDQLVYYYANHEKPVMIALNKSFISDFEMHGSTFKYIRGFKNIKNGFYEEIVTGPASFFIRWEKYEQPASVNPQDNFELQKKWYIKKDNKFYLVKNRWNVYEALNDQKTEIKEYIRKNIILVAFADERELLGIINHYNKLKSTSGKLDE